MKTFKIYKNNDGAPSNYMSKYDALAVEDSSATRSWLEASPMAIHYEVPAGESAEDCAPVLVVDTWSKEGEADTTTDPEDNTWSLTSEHYELQVIQATQDANIEAARDSKLNTLRSQRSSKFAEADRELNKHIDGDTNKVGLEADWKTYRVSLRNTTDSYKDHSTDGGHATAIDAEDADWAGYTWPTKPV